MRPSKQLPHDRGGGHGTHRFAWLDIFRGWMQFPSVKAWLDVRPRHAASFCVSAPPIGSLGGLRLANRAKWLESRYRRQARRRFRRRRAALGITTASMSSGGLPGSQQAPAPRRGLRAGSTPAPKARDLRVQLIVRPLQGVDPNGLRLIPREPAPGPVGSARHHEFFSAAELGNTPHGGFLLPAGKAGAAQAVFPVASAAASPTEHVDRRD